MSMFSYFLHSRHADDLAELTRPPTRSPDALENPMTDRAPTLPEIEAALTRLAPLVRRTPVWEWRDDFLPARLGPGTSVNLKLELFQHSGTFKARGALMNMLTLDSAAIKRGVTAVSAGNHAAAVAYAAHSVGTNAKVVMPKTASAARIAICERYGAEIVFAEDAAAAFGLVKAIEVAEGRTFVHPFEGPVTATGTATLGLEFLRQMDDLDAVVVPIGGGGLIGGIAAAVKQAKPECLVYGVEPAGNDVIKRSVAAGRPEPARDVDTIADSLSPPFALPYSLGLIQRFVDDIVLVSDDDLTASLYLLFSRMKLAVEPAGAATTAALLGPLARALAGKKVGLIICGANIAADRFAQYLDRGERRWRERTE
jgi:threonine dehydratase